MTPSKVCVRVRVSGARGVEESGSFFSGNCFLPTYDGWVDLYFLFFLGMFGDFFPPCRLPPEQEPGILFIKKKDVDDEWRLQHQDARGSEDVRSLSFRA